MAVNNHGRHIHCNSLNRAVQRTKHTSVVVSFLKLHADFLVAKAVSFPFLRASFPGLGAPAKCK